MITSFEQYIKESNNILLAPNGKPSKLTPTQYELVRTENFKKWFGDWENSPETSSKVLDENGEPLVVYHRTKTKFNKFIKNDLNGWLGSGFYFSENKDDFKEYGRVVIKCFLNIRNLFVSQSQDWFGVIAEVYGKNKGGLSDNITKKLEEDGYNGINMKHWEKGLIINCFNPNDIKLADGTNTTFNPQSDNINENNHFMLNNPETIKHIDDIGGPEDRDFIIKTYISDPKRYIPNTYYHVNSDTNYPGAGEGLYLGRDKKVLKRFYDNEDRGYSIDVYSGEPKWLDLMEYNKWNDFVAEAIEKYGKHKRNNHLKELCLEKGFDGIIYFDAQATGEEYVLYNTNKLKHVKRIKGIKNDFEL